MTAIGSICTRTGSVGLRYTSFPSKRTWPTWSTDPSRISAARINVQAFFMLRTPNPRPAAAGGPRQSLEQLHRDLARRAIHQKQQDALQQDNRVQPGAARIGFEGLGLRRAVAGPAIHALGELNPTLQQARRWSDSTDCGHSRKLLDQARHSYRCDHRNCPG